MNVKKVIALLIIPCLLIIIVQIELANPGTRELFTKIDDYERKLAIKDSSEVHYVLLSLEEGIPSDGITVYINSRPAMRFSSKKIRIPVDCPGIMEIRNDTNSVVKVCIEDTDCSVDILNKLFPRGIKSLCRINQVPAQAFNISFLAIISSILFMYSETSLTLKIRSILEPSIIFVEAPAPSAYML